MRAEDKQARQPEQGGHTTAIKGRVTFLSILSEVDRKCNYLIMDQKL